MLSSVGFVFNEREMKLHPGKRTQSNIAQPPVPCWKDYHDVEGEVK